jgi:hypothetical protein
MKAFPTQGRDRDSGLPKAAIINALVIPVTGRGRSRIFYAIDSQMALPLSALLPINIFWYSFLLEAQSTLGP